MNIHALREAQARFEPQKPNIVDQREKWHRLRRQFVHRFDLAHLARMTKEEYVLGLERGVEVSFCYAIERQLDPLGRILGSPADKFGVYFGKTRSDPAKQYRFTQKFGDNADHAFRAVRASILELVEAGQIGDTTTIIKNRLSPMFKGKILSSYFPETYLNIFSDRHLTYYITQLDLDTPVLLKSDAVIKRQALLDFKQADAVMANWSVDIFAYFLYTYYLGAPRDEPAGPGDPLEPYRTPEFPPNPTPELITLDLLPPVEPSPSEGSRRRPSHPDYEGQARAQKLVGDRGEKVVLDMERARLRAAGRPDLAGRVAKAEYDYLGFDILSFEADGSDRHIEVKTTIARAGDAQFFLTINEWQQASTLPNYQLYIVFEILSVRPKVWILPNPFHPEHPHIVKTPVLLKVAIRTTPV